MGLNKEQARQLVEYVNIYCDKVGMEPPSYVGLMRNPGVKYDKDKHGAADVMQVRYKWESEVVDGEELDHE